MPVSQLSVHTMHCQLLQLLRALPFVLVTCQMLFLSPNQQWQNTAEG